LGLGDVGNDIGIYGTKLYTVINASNKLEIMDVATTKRLEVIDIKNGRYITFANGKAYVSAYDGDIGLGQNTPNGFVAEIDTTTMAITRRVEVGRQPEELAVVDGKLYVANSGGYSPPNYERTVSVVDLNSFAVVNKIDVAPNLHRLRATESGDLYVSSRGDYFENPSQLFVVDTKKGEVKSTYNIPTSNLTIVGDTAYIVGSSFSYETFDWEIGYRMINIKEEKLLDGSFLPKNVSDEIEMPYGIAVDPMSKNIYITDARDYVSPGTLYCIDKNKAVKFTVKTGDIPAHFAFVYKTTTIENKKLNKTN
jgi:DNA-binding beta-propeller fold protein YncE